MLSTISAQSTIPTQYQAESKLNDLMKFKTSKITVWAVVRVLVKAQRKTHQQNQQRLTQCVTPSACHRLQLVCFRNQSLSVLPVSYQSRLCLYVARHQQQPLFRCKFADFHSSIYAAAGLCNGDGVWESTNCRFYKVYS